MIRLGLTSQAFPILNASEVAAVASKAGLEGIEWAAESHLAPGDHGLASALLMQTLMARLTIVSFAALYRVQPGLESGLGFDALLETASAIQCPILRIFVGAKPWTRMTEEERRALRSELLRLGDRAGARGVTVALSFSRGTALEDYRSAEELLGLAEHAFIRLAWEPLAGIPAEEADAALARLSARTALVLARHADRRGRGGPLSEDASLWEGRIDAFQKGEVEPKMSRFVLLGRIGESDAERVNEDAGFLASVVKARNPARR